MKETLTPEQIRKEVERFMLAVRVAATAEALPHTAHPPYAAQRMREAEALREELISSLTGQAQEVERLQALEEAVGRLPNSLLTFTYLNHQDEVDQRLVVIERIYFGSTSYYPEPQWLLHGWDVDRDAERTFALARIYQTPQAARAVARGSEEA